MSLRASASASSLFVSSFTSHTQLRHVLSVAAYLGESGRGCVMGCAGMKELASPYVLVVQEEDVEVLGDGDRAGGQRLHGFGGGDDWTRGEALEAASEAAAT